MSSLRALAVMLSLVLPLALSCSGPRVGAEAVAAEREGAKATGPASAAVRELDDVSTFPTFMPVIAFGALTTECDPSDDPFNSCV